MEDNRMDKVLKKQRRRIFAGVVASGVVVLLAVLPMLASGSGADSGVQASILSATVEYRDVDMEIVGGGQLASLASVRIQIPEEVKLKEYLVGNGDTVSQGDPIAAVDRVSVMTAITGVQETLDYLSEEIANASGDTAPDTVKALAAGTVKAVYAKAGESAADVMLAHGALAVLSLDDIMAVQLEADTDLNPGDTVSVTVGDGEPVDGRVKSNLSGVLTVTFDDDCYAVGAEVTVRTADGQGLGAGELYIYSPWNAAAYSGTVSDVLVEEGASVYVGQTLLKLEDPGSSAEYQQLIDQRHEYEALMQELFTMYRTQTVTAPCDGIVTGVDTDGAFLLSATEAGWTGKLLSFFTGDDAEGFVAHTAKVASVSDDGLALLVNPNGQSVSDLAGLSGIAANISGMTESWHYSGDRTVYIQTSEGLLQAAGTAKAGDILLAVGDRDNVYWFVLLDGTAQTSGSGSNLTARLLSDMENTDTGEEPGDGDGGDAPVPETVRITTEMLNPGIVGQNYISALQASDGNETLSGTWSTEGMPDGLTLDAKTGVIYGTPTAAGTFEVTVCFECDGGNAKKVFSLTVTESGQPGGDDSGDFPSGDLPSGGMSIGGMSSGGVGQTQAFEPYSLDKLTVASVTSQEHMTLDVTEDELDISQIHVGQSATVTVDALAGEHFSATVSQIANSGTNDGGSSKFTVELTLEKSGDMLPGMTASAFIRLDGGENLLCVPAAALGEENGKTVLYTGYDEKNAAPGSPVPVTVGAADADYVQILTGLSQGDTVYYAYYDTPETAGGFPQR